MLLKNNNYSVLEAKERINTYTILNRMIIAATILLLALTLNKIFIQGTAYWRIIIPLGFFIIIKMNKDQYRIE